MKLLLVVVVALWVTWAGMGCYHFVTHNDPNHTCWRFENGICLLPGGAIDTNYKP